MPYKLTTDVFCLDHLDGYVAYVPLKGLVLMVNRAAADLLANWMRGTVASLMSETSKCCLSLWTLGW